MMPRHLSTTTVIFSLLFFCVFHNEGLAQDTSQRNPILTSKLEAGFGIYSPSQVIRIGANGSTDNKKIDFGKALDFQSRNFRPNAYLKWRFFKRWSFYVDYFNFYRSVERRAEKEIKWKDYIFDTNTYLKIGLGLDVIRANIGYTVLDRPNQNLIIGLGVHTLGIKPSLEGDASINDKSVHYQTKSTYAIAPLPNLIARYTFAINTQWALSAKVDWLALKLGDYSGGIWDVGPVVTYQFIKHFNISMDYRHFQVYGDVDQKNWGGSFYIQFSGPTLSVNAVF